MVLELINNMLSSIESFHTVSYYWVAFFAALFETTIGIGLLLLGSTIILFLGALSSQGNPDITYLILFSILGAITGDNLNYFLGRKYGAKWLKDGFDNPDKLERAVRAHWSIENNLYQVLDVVFDEDSNRTRKGYSAANLAVTRHIALNLIKAEKTAKVGVKTKRLMAGWDNNYLLKIIGSI